VKLGVTIVVVTLLTPAFARAAARLSLQGTYDCRIHGNQPLNTGQVFVDATLTLIPGPLNSFRSGSLKGMKTTASSMPLSVTTPQPYTNTLTDWNFKFLSSDGDQFASFTLDWEANTSDFPTPDTCLVRITKTGFPRLIESFILSCFENQTFPFNGICDRR
jgi:hypothetical protein